MGRTTTWRENIRARLTTHIPDAHVRVVSKIKTALKTNMWDSPTLFVELERLSVEPENRLVGFGEQLAEMPFTVYIAVRGTGIDPAGAGIDDDRNVLERLEEMTLGVHDLIDSVEAALMFQEMGTTPQYVVPLSGGWEPYDDGPFTLVVASKWVMKGALVTQS